MLNRNARFTLPLSHKLGQTRQEFDLPERLFRQGPSGWLRGGLGWLFSPPTDCPTSPTLRSLIGIGSNPPDLLSNS